MESCDPYARQQKISHSWADTRAKLWFDFRLTVSFIALNLCVLIFSISIKKIIKNTPKVFFFILRKWQIIS